MTETRAIDRSARVCRDAEVASGETRLVHVGRREVLLCRSTDGTLYAVGNACPHQGAPLCKGAFGGSTVAPEIGRYAFGLDGEVVRCPWHNWEFDVKTGQALFGENKRIRTYEVWVDDGDIYVSARGKVVRRQDEE